MGTKLVSVMRAHKLLGRGYEGFLCHVVKTKEAGPSLEDILVVREFPYVFPDEILEMPPLREVEFCIDLTPRATPISKVLYQMAPAELKELKSQLQELLERVTSSQYVSMGSHGLICEEERRVSQNVYRL